MAAIKINFHVSFRVIVPMLQHRPFQNIKPDGNEFKMFYKKNVIYWLIHIDLQIHEIFPSRLANPVNKLVLRTRLLSDFATLSGNIPVHSFVYRIFNSLGKYFLYLKVNVN